MKSRSRLHRGALALVVLVIATLIAAPQADANTGCDVGEPFTTGPTNFNLSSGRAFLEGFDSTEAALDNIILNGPTFFDQMTPEDRVFSDELLTWLTRLSNCNEAVAYPGPFTNMPPVDIGIYGWGTPNITATAAPAAELNTPATTTTTPLAHTGLNTSVLGILGVTMLGAGALIEAGCRTRKRRSN